MLAFFNCVAAAVVEKGLPGLAGMLPGGKFAYDVAEAAWKKYRERKKDAEARAEIQQLAAATFDEARRAAVEAVREAVADKPGVTDLDRLHLELYLSQIPAAVRQTLKRGDDPTGTTVPASLALSSPADLVELLPARPPLCAPGHPLPGKPGWALVEPLGVGGFGEVWLARHARMNSLAGAVKFCHGDAARGLLHESALIDRVMAAGKHPNIVPLLDVDLDAETPWVMFEYAGGGDLSDAIRSWQGLERGPRIERVLDALGELSGAVGHFHRLSPAVVHRDLKPSNILRDQATGRLRITDFGIGAVAARAALGGENGDVGTRGGRLLSYLRGSHTPLYASPQQRAGADPDPRDDVHALGVIAYQMLTGELAHGVGVDFGDDLRDAGAPEGLIDLVGRCVAQKAARRPADGLELNEQLQQLTTAAAVVRPVPVPPQQVAAAKAKADEKVAPSGERDVFGARPGTRTHAIHAVLLAATEPLTVKQIADLSKTNATYQHLRSMLQRRLVRKTDDGRYVLTSRDGTGATAFADEDTGEGGSAERADSEDSPGVIASIVEFLREATEATPLSKAGILAKLTERFPDRPPEAMKKTIGCQVPSRLRSEKGLAVRQNAGGFWIIADEGAGLRSGPTLPPEPFQEAAGEAQQVAGDDETFREWLVRTLREQDRNVAAGVAERLFAWADANGYQECGNRTPSPGGSLRFALRHSGQQFEVFSFGGKGELQLPLQYMMTGPFKEERLRREYLDRIGRIPGVYERRERWDRLTGWPSFPLEALAEPANFDQFLQAVDWAAEEIRTGQV